jgi:ATP-dependent DNA helicase RecQ
MKDYAETRDWGRRYILNYFGEEYRNPCGYCDNCDAGTSQKVQAETSDLPFALKSRVRHKKFGDGVVLRYEEDGGKVVVQFDAEGERSMAVDVVIEMELMQTI